MYRILFRAQDEAWYVWHMTRHITDARMAYYQAKSQGMVCVLVCPGLRQRQWSHNQFFVEVDINLADEVWRRGYDHLTEPLEYGEPYWAPRFVETWQRAAAIGVS